MKKIFALVFLLATMSLAFACGDGSNADVPSTNVDLTLENPGDTPTEAYKRLFNAVKFKNTEAIKAEVSQATHPFAESLSAQQKKPIEAVYENGFTETTFSATLPEIRDERIKDKMGAIEVWNSTKKKWEDLPYVRETTGWKLAIGDIWTNKYRSPGKGRDMKEREAANAMSPNAGMKRVEGPGNFNANFNGAPRPPMPQNK